MARLAVTNIRGITLTEPLSREEFFKRKFERVSIELTDLRRVNRKLMRSGGINVEGAVEEIIGLLRAEKDIDFSYDITKIGKVKQRQKPLVNKNHFEHAASIWSDWHLSEVVKAEDSNGINTYNSKVAAARIWELVETTKQLLSLHQVMYPLKKFHIFILGDMINGSIHDELRLTNDLTDPAAAVLCARLIVMALNEVASLGIPLQIECVIGNHPRMSAKMPTKAQAQTSYDWIVYEMVADAFTNHTKVDVNVHTGQIATVDILGWRYVLEHGIQWKNGSEENFEDKIRALFDDPTFREATGLVGPAFDQIAIGNLHKAAFLERTIKNGALTGQNELGQSWRLKPIKAIQLIWGISKDHVRTWQYSIDVTKIKDANKSNPLVDYTKGYMKRHGKS